MKIFPIMKVQVGLLVVLQIWLVSVSHGSPRPHIVLIVADDLGWNDVSFHGSEQIPTPNMDKLAYTGIILNNYYVQPICTPTRSALMTGRHPIHTGMQHSVIVGDQPYGLPLSETLIPQYLNKLGYRSQMIGKWHLGFFANEYTPTYRGFESHFGYFLGHEDYFNHMSDAAVTVNKSELGLDFRRNMDLLKNFTGNYSTDLFTAEAVNVIERHNQSEPLFLYLPYQAVHSANIQTEPLQAPKKYIERFPHIKNMKRRTYAGMVSALDDGIGKVMQALDHTGMTNNSIIVFTTDNGGPSNGFDANAASNFPLRGLKATLWEGGVRGVGFINSPLLQKTGYVSEQMMHVCDWLPTLYKAAGGDPTKLQNLDGHDSWEMLSTNGKPVRSEILHNIDPVVQCGGIRSGDYKLLVGDVGVKYNGWYPPWQLEKDSEFLHVDNREKNNRIYFVEKFISNTERISEQYMTKGPVVINCGVKPKNASTNCQPTNITQPCLFHIPSDPCEYNNIAADNYDIVIQLMKKLEEYSLTMVPPGNKPFDPKGSPDLHGGAWGPWIKL